MRTLVSQQACYLLRLVKFMPEHAMFKSTYFLLFAVFLLHAACLFYFFPPADLFTHIPINFGDFTHHFYNSYKVGQFLDISGKTWGYDPYFLAGYPGGLIMSVDNKLLEVLVWIFSGFVNQAVAFKLFVVLSYLSLPFVVFGAAKNFRLDDSQALGAALAAVVFWYLDPVIHNCWILGMNSWVLVAFLSLLVISFFYRFLQGGGYFLLLILGILVFYTHPLVFPILFFPMATGYIVRFKSLTGREHLYAALFVVIVLLANMIWLMPLSRILPYIISPSEESRYVFLSGFRTTLEEFFLGVINMVPITLGSHRFKHTVFFLGLWGIFRWDQKDIRFHLFLSTFLSLFFLTYLGGRFPLTNSISPYRYSIPLAFFMIVPAMPALGRVKYLWRSGSKGTKFIMGIAIVLLLSNYMYSAYQSTLYPQFSCRLSEDQQKIIAWIREKTDSGGRILFRLKHGRLFPATLPYFVKREFVGGFYQEVYLQHNFVNYVPQETLFRKKIDDIGFKELKEYFELYNIKWIFTYNTEYFDRFPDYLASKTAVGNMFFYEVNRKPSFFLKGGGRVQADYNKITVSEASSGGIVLKYHWFEDLETIPPLPLKRYRALDDPVGFILVDNENRRDFVIRVKYQ